MIKGCQKRIIHITNTGSPYFDEAYFVLKRGGEAAEADEDDNMVKEAMRIAGDTLSGVRGREKRKRKKRTTAFLYGASLTSLVFGFVMLIILVLS